MHKLERILASRFVREDESRHARKRRSPQTASRCMRPWRVTAVVLSVAILALMAAGTSNAGSSGVTLATGSFTLLGPEFAGLPNGSNRTFAFTVHQSPSGAISGQAELRTFGGDIVHIAISCFTLEGNQAIVGGIETLNTQIPEFVGTGAAFAIQDDPDLATFVVSPDTTCESLVPDFGESDLGSLLADLGVPIGTGNIMIRHAN